MWTQTITVGYNKMRFVTLITPPNKFTVQTTSASAMEYNFDSTTKMVSNNKTETFHNHHPHKS